MRTLFRTRVVRLLALALAVSLAPSGAPVGADESIGVGGHWVIEVRDPDGTVVTRREFHNALVGGTTITQLILGQRRAGPIRVELDCVGIGCVHPCASLTPGGPAAACVIHEAREMFTLGALDKPSPFNNLIVSSGPSGLQLRGFAVVSATTTVASFQTFLVICPATVGSCVKLPGPTPGDLFPERALLTATVVSPGIDVATGQQVLVTITIAAATGPALPATTPQGVAPSR